MVATEILSPARRRIAVWALVLSALPVGIVYGVSTPLIALVLEDQGYSATLIGLNTIMFPIGILVAGPLLPRLLHRLGPTRTILAGMTLEGTALVLFPVLDTLVAWFALRFLLGFGVGFYWIVGESWLNSLADPSRRGRLLALYVTMLSAGFAAGPEMLSWLGTEGAIPFWTTAAIMVPAALSLLFVHQAESSMAAEPSTRLLPMVLMFPLAMVAAALGGALEGAVFSLLPVYGLGIGLDQTHALRLIVVFAAGNLILQIVIGTAADRLQARPVLVALGIICTLSVAVLPLTAGTALVWPLAFLWGGAAFGLYTVGLVNLGQRARNDQLTAGNAAFVMFYQLGLIAGPVFSGAAMDALPPHGYTIVLALFAAAFSAFAIYRMRSGRGKDR